MTVFHNLCRDYHEITARVKKCSKNVQKMLNSVQKREKIVFLKSFKRVKKRCGNKAVNKGGEQGEEGEEG